MKKSSDYDASLTPEEGEREGRGLDFTQNDPKYMDSNKPSCHEMQLHKLYTLPL